MKIVSPCFYGWEFYTWSILLCAIHTGINISLESNSQPFDTWIPCIKLQFNANKWHLISAQWFMIFDNDCWSRIIISDRISLGYTAISIFYMILIRIYDEIGANETEASWLTGNTNFNIISCCCRRFMHPEHCISKWLGRDGESIFAFIFEADKLITIVDAFFGRYDSRF